MRAPSRARCWSPKRTWSGCSLPAARAPPPNSRPSSNFCQARAGFAGSPPRQAMADIGSTLRETRIRKKIDITSVEEATKIRAKYLRALENEEWVLLPGPTYVKTFLRTYTEYLGLDPRMLVEEYSARFEQPENLELPPFSREARLRTRVTRVPPPSRWGLVAGVIVAILVFLLVLGLTGGGDDGGGGTRTTRAAAKHRDRGRDTSAPGTATERPR